MNCPICKKDVAFGEPFMPFCSERCRLLDLGNWLDERYVITKPVEPKPETEEDERRGDSGER